MIARVGAGGMGVVYKGWDPRLERDVAIKVLHPEAADGDLQRRLLAEGRAASALNHPNILRVYDADVDGSSYYLVSEWLEGKSLRDELSRGPLATRRLLDLAVQIADGLAAAHAMGIVHRDIKPENIVLARDGSARIVDFGLARHDRSRTAGVADGQQTTTVTLEGGLSGTPPYMSPEQARGQMGDFRTDQFSFGTLLYEMATGVRAFRRESVADTLAAVLHDDPKPIAERNPRVPVALTWVVEQCLAKDPSERYAATEDLAREIRRVRDRLREALAEQTHAEVRRSPLRTAAIVAAAAIIGAALVAVPATFAPSVPELKFTPIASEAAYEGTPVWSADSLSLAWIADVDGVLQVFTRRLIDAIATQLTRGRFDAEAPFWAPDGKSVYFISRAGDGMGLWNVRSAGGRAELVLENVNYAAIDPASKRLALLRMDDDNSIYLRLWWASATGEAPVLETRPPIGQRGYGLGGQLQFRPDGQQLLFWAFTADQRDNEPVSQFFLVPTDPALPVTTTLTQVVAQANLQPASWLPDNRHVVIGVAEGGGGSRHLWLADTQSQALQRLTATHTSETFPSAAPAGSRIAFASEEVDFDLVTISEDGRTSKRILATARNEMDAAWAPDGEQFAFVTDRTGEMEIWIRSRDGQWERPVITAGDFSGARTDTLGSVTYSPNGRTLAFQRRGPGGSALWLAPSTGGTPGRLLPEGESSSYQDAPSWSPDGEWISFVRSNGPQFSLAKVRSSGEEVTALLPHVMPFTRSAWSPDGRWIVCETADGFVKVPAAGGAPDVIFDEPLLAYAWTPDSRRIAALVEGDVLGHMAMIEIDIGTRDVKTVNPDLGTIPIAYQPIRGLSYAKGAGFLTSFASARSDIWLLEGFAVPGRGILDWLRRR